ncbi:Copper-transporting P-type ATPase [Enhygromyxa salina]|uniref:Copper-transporting P-type ATPase n=1 Tax=Enhygromyxa salina TaxID=215803 RepID=A0A2S9YET0_9BACT|nr:heavy metal-associated domain-containing protein [Enhygromyxa salina]PRQ03531.1 Copper-transporting P-type ATPase [Enhygromyxa salina]
MPARRLPALALATVLLIACKAEPRVMQVEIAVEGMTCESCVQGITYELERLEGVRSVEVDLDGGKATVTYTEGAAEPAGIEEVIEKIGYEAEPGEAVAVDEG